MVDRNLNEIIRRARKDPSEENLLQLGLNYLRSISRHKKQGIFVVLENDAEESNVMGPFDWVEVYFGDLVCGVDDMMFKIAEQSDINSWSISYNASDYGYDADPKDSNIDTEDQVVYKRFLVDIREYD